MQEDVLTMFAGIVIVVWFREFIQACCMLRVFCERIAQGIGK
jgi:hypothetical protein